MTGLELVAFCLGLVIMLAGVWENTRQSLALEPELPLWRWVAIWGLSLVPFALVGGVLIWLGSPAVTR